MSLTARTKIQLVDKVNTCFAGIGVTNGAKMPKSGDNREPIAWELWLAYHLARLANKRKSNAEDAAVIEGVIFDKERNPKPAGTKEVLFNGEIVSIAVEVKQPAKRVNTDKLIAFLANKKVPAGLLVEALEYASKENRPAHVFDPVLITDDA